MSCRWRRRNSSRSIRSPGWVEHDPQEIWSTQAGVAAEAVTRAGMNGTSIAAIGITNQRETTIVWDRETGHPVYNAIVWQDRRTAEFCDQLKAQGLEEKVRAKTGLPIDSYFSATKIRWILDNVEGAREKARQGRLAFGTVDSWLVWNFTRHGLHITDVTNASRTMLFNIHTLQWDDELLDALDIPRSMLPEVRPSSEVYGPTKTTVFASKIPLAGIAGDQHAALFGQMCTEAGHGEEHLRHRLLPRDEHRRHADRIAQQPRHHDRLADRRARSTTRSKAASSSRARSSSGCATASASSGARLKSSRWRAACRIPTASISCPRSRGSARRTGTRGRAARLFGVTRGTNSSHIARAALDSIAYQSLDVLKAMEADSGIRIAELRVDGGACANNLLMQFQADILGVDVVRPQVAETTALGAAYLAGLAVGYWKDVGELKQPVEARTALHARDAAGGG